MILLLSLLTTLSHAADLDEDGCEDSYFTANRACVAPSATVGSGTTVGASASVAAYTSVGPDMALGANTYIGERSSLLGRSVRAGLRPIGANTVLGRRTTIGLDPEIGADNTWSRSVTAGTWLTTQDDVTIGYGTTMGDDVYVGAGTTIGTLVTVGTNTNLRASTVLGREVTIADSDNATMIGGIIGPNVTIGSDVTIAADARIRKDVTIEDGVAIGAGARIGRDVTLREGAQVGDNVSIGTGAEVTADSVVPDDTVIDRGTVYDNVPPTGVFSGGSLLDSTAMEQINGWYGDAEQNWVLCFQMSTDGRSSSAFRAQCASHGETVTVVSANGKLFGGYTPITWNASNSYTYEATDSSFLFSITNDFRHDLISSTNHVYRANSAGPIFGSGHDMVSFYDSGASSFCAPGYAYECRIGTAGSSTCNVDLCGADFFTPTEVEVYRKE